MEFIESQRGFHKLAYKGYFYTKHRVLTSGATSWLCEQRSHCKSRMTILDGTATAEPSMHTHAPDCAHIEAQKVRRELKRRATFTQESTQQLLSEATQQLSSSAGTKLPV